MEWIILLGAICVYLGTQADKSERTIAIMLIVIGGILMAVGATGFVALELLAK